MDLWKENGHTTSSAILKQPSAQRLKTQQLGNVIRMDESIPASKVFDIGTAGGRWKEEKDLHTVRRIMSRLTWYFQMVPNSEEKEPMAGYC